MFKRVMTLPAAKQSGTIPSHGLIDLGVATVETRGSQEGSQVDGIQPQRYNPLGLNLD